MEQLKIKVENLKCGGCATTISSKLLAMPDVLGVEVSLENAEVSVNHNGKLAKEKLLQKLKQLGYPEVDSLHGLESKLVEAKSFISCAIGKINI
jgi:copper chaperone